MDIRGLTSKIKSLAGEIGKRVRRNDEDRMAAGKLLIELRAKFGVQTKSGSFRNPLGAFCEHLEKSGINVASAYRWIAVAEGKECAYEKVRNTVAVRLSAIKKAETQPAKVRALRELVTWVMDKYEVEASVEIKAPKARGAKA